MTTVKAEELMLTDRIMVNDRIYTVTAMEMLTEGVEVCACDLLTHEYVDFRQVEYKTLRPPVVARFNAKPLVENALLKLILKEVAGELIKHASDCRAAMMMVDYIRAQEWDKDSSEIHSAYFGLLYTAKAAAHVLPKISVHYALLNAAIQQAERVSR